MVLPVIVILTSDTISENVVSIFNCKVFLGLNKYEYILVIMLFTYGMTYL